MDPGSKTPSALPEPRPQDEAALGDFLSWLSVERGRSRATVVAYQRDLSAYLRWLASQRRCLMEAGPKEVEGFLASLAPSRSGASRARALSALRGLHRFLLRTGQGPSDPALEVPRPSVARPLPKAISREQMERLLGGVVGEGPAVLRDRAILELGYASGLRVSELVGLDLVDLDLEERLVRVLGKGSRERIVPFGLPAEQALRKWLGPGGRPTLLASKGRGTGEAVFLNMQARRLTRQGIWTIIANRAQAVGLQVSPHVLRHSCATHLLEGGADIRVVQEMLGHASISTTQIYTKVTPEHLRAVLEAAHPRGSLVARG